MNNIVITQATEEDLPVILDVQKKTFLEVARVYNVKSLPPLEQTLESVTDEFMNGTILIASLVRTSNQSKFLDSRLRTLKGTSGNDKDDTIIVGSVRAHKKKDTCYIGKLVVLPDYQNKGIGKALMQEIENQYKNKVSRCELFTGTRDPRNRHLYDQLGYKPFKTEKLNDEISFIYMEKSA
jgi:ribosomal protein S18 acetylase RimI-like enzyme